MKEIYLWRSRSKSFGYSRKSEKNFSWSSFWISMNRGISGSRRPIHSRTQILRRFFFCFYSSNFSAISAKSPSWNSLFKLSFWWSVIFSIFLYSEWNFVKVQLYINNQNSLSKSMFCKTHFVCVNTSAILGGDFILKTHRLAKSLCWNHLCVLSLNGGNSVESKNCSSLNMTLLYEDHRHLNI